MPVADLVAEHVDTPSVAAALAADGVFGAMLGPWSAGSGLLFLLHAANQSAGDPRLVWPRGGPGSLTAALVRAAELAGVTIRTGARVAEVLSDATGTRGVRLADGTALDGTTVVSGIDPKTTYGLCDPMTLPSEVRWRARNYRTAGTLAKVNLALSALPVVPGADREQLATRIRMAADVDAMERAFDHVKYGAFSPSPWLEALIPSLGDPRCASGGARDVDHAQCAARCARLVGDSARRSSPPCSRPSTASCRASARSSWKQKCSRRPTSNANGAWPAGTSITASWRSISSSRCGRCSSGGNTAGRCRGCGCAAPAPRPGLTGGWARTPPVDPERSVTSGRRCYGAGVVVCS
jgi:hypothetical protein